MRIFLIEVSWKYIWVAISYLHGFLNKTQFFVAVMRDAVIVDFYSGKRDVYLCLGDGHG